MELLASVVQDLSQEAFSLPQDLFGATFLKGLFSKLRNILTAYQLGLCYKEFFCDTCYQMKGKQ